MQQQGKKKKWKKEIVEGVVHLSRLKPFKKGTPQKNKKQSYDEWWQEKNMDGSFAYNGVTDDF
jgi:hypothetical protein